MRWCAVITFGAVIAAGCGGGDGPAAPSGGGDEVQTGAYHGTWSGRAVLVECADDPIGPPEPVFLGSVVPVCATTSPSVGIGVSLSHIRDVRGEVRIHVVTVPVTGTVGPSDLVLIGEGQSGTHAVRIHEWRSEVASDGAMTGTLIYTVGERRGVALVNAVRVTRTLEAMVKTSNEPSL
jgi:hypothetical protein